MSIRAGFLLFIFVYFAALIIFTLAFPQDGERVIPLATEGGVIFIDSYGNPTTVESECSSGIRVFKKDDEIILMSTNDATCVDENNE